MCSLKTHTCTFNRDRCPQESGVNFLNIIDAMIIMLPLSGSSPVIRNIKDYSWFATDLDGQLLDPNIYRPLARAVTHRIVEGCGGSGGWVGYIPAPGEDGNPQYSGGVVWGVRRMGGVYTSPWRGW